MYSFLSLSVEEVQKIVSALDEMPHKMVRTLLDKLMAEVQKQDAARKMPRSEQPAPVIDPTTGV